MDTILDSQIVRLVNDPQIEFVTNLDTGETIDYEAAMGSDRGALIRLRTEVKARIKDRPLFICPLCASPVYIVSRCDGHFFFRHTLEDGRCSKVTRGELSQDEINALKYNGAKESYAHQKMKHWVAESLRADKNFTEIEIEKRWAGQLMYQWRQPDVQACYKGIRIAFEVQLSTTFLDVIVERKKFYLEEGGLLFWIFANFHTEKRALLQDDIFYNNNRNAFIVSTQTYATSLQEKRFSLECIWSQPHKDVAEIKRKAVFFDELTLDQEKQRAFYYDYDGVKQRHEEARLQEHQKRQQVLRDEFEAWWLACISDNAINDEEWRSFRLKLRNEGIAFPEDQQYPPKILLNALYSVKRGEIIGWNFKKFIEIIHHVADKRKSYLRYVVRALKVYERNTRVKQEDRTGRWNKKYQAYVKKAKNHDLEYERDKIYESLIKFLFPKIFKE